ncbi:MAG: DUF4358 domain-containing protein [Gudongella sp.]|nr:DUF4358 domain-containing protein [Gudongella sp.]
MKKILVFGVIAALIAGILGGCAVDKPEVKEIDLNEVLEAVKNELGEDYYPDRDMELEEVLAYTGLSEDEISEYIAQSPMISINVDTFIGIKATEGNGDNVYEGLNSYREFLVNDSMQYPMNLPKINASKVVRFGDYSFFIMVGARDEMVEDVDSNEAREFAESETAKVESVITDIFN